MRRGFSFLLGELLQRVSRVRDEQRPEAVAEGDHAVLFLVIRGFFWDREHRQRGGGGGRRHGSARQQAPGDPSEYLALFWLV